MDYRSQCLKSKLTNFFIYKTTPEQTALLFAIEGILLALMANIINNNNNLFATRLGASNFQISLVASLPQLIGMLVLIPGGIMTDRMKNKRKMVVSSLILVALLYIVIGFVPLFGDFKVIAFLGILALSAGPMTLYNTSWQAYFSDVVVEDDRNRVFSLRTKWSFAVGITIPLITGTLLVSADTVKDKITYHQLFFWIAAFLILVQILVLKKITGGIVLPQQHMSLGDLKRAMGELVKDKKYMSFVGVALFFYMVWQSDWTLYYIGQVNYLDFNEQWLSFVIVGGATIQFLSIGFWTRLNERLGIWFSIILGTLGLSIYPIAMIVSTSLPLSIGKPVFIILIVVAGFGFTAIPLNILQCLLQVVPVQNKTLSISVYTVLITLSNVVMPMAGVLLYTILGATKSALDKTFIIIFIARIIAAGLWTLLWRQNRQSQKVKKAIE